MGSQWNGIAAQIPNTFQQYIGISLIMKVVQEKVVTVDGHTGVKRYVMLEKLGEGSYSQCIKVQVSGTEQYYAMKVIPKAILRETQRQKLLEQIRIQQSLSHQHIVFLDHWFEDSINHYILLEYCPGKTLEERCVKFSTMDEKYVRRYGSQLLQALQYLHSQKVMHRDLKLTNSFLSADDEVKLGDFGLACRLQSTHDLKRDPCGTPDFAAPELIGGFGYSYPADVWSFGVVLYRMKFGYCPFDMVKVEDTLRKIKSADYTFPRWVAISPELTDLISRILVIDYDDRLTLDEIEDHPFFKTPVPRVSSFRALVTKLFTGDSKDKDKKRIDSCQNRKDIKKILKERTEGTSIITPKAKNRDEVVEDNIDSVNRNSFECNRTFSRSTNSEQVSKIKVSSKKLVITEQSKSISTAANSKDSMSLGELQSNKQLPKLYLLQDSQVKVIPIQPKPPLQKHLQLPTQRIARLMNKFKSDNTAESIMTRYTSFLIYELQQQGDYTILYLSNGLRQIINQNQIFFVIEPGQYIDTSSSTVEYPPKLLEYICQQKLKDSKFKLTQQAIKAIIQKGNYVGKCRKLDGGWLMFTVSAGIVLAAANSKLFYLKTEKEDFLYNQRLEIVTNQKEVGKFRQIFDLATKNRDRSANRHKKLLE